MTTKSSEDRKVKEVLPKWQGESGGGDLPKNKLSRDEFEAWLKKNSRGFLGC